MNLHSSSVADSGAYTDLNRLHQLKVGEGRDSEANIRKVAQEFESLFLSEMMKAMRAAGDVLADDNFMNSNESKTYRDMYDQQLSLTLSQGKGMGMADVLTRQLSQAPKPSTANPFTQEIVSPAAAPATQAVPAKVNVALDRQRDDTALLNQRRLALPVTAAGRALAGLGTAAQGSFANNLGQQSAREAQNFQVAKSYPAAEKNTLATANAVDINRKQFASPEEFVATMLPMAEQAAKKLGVDPRYLVAQAALETGWGKSIIRGSEGGSSHNLFGIKAHGWGGGSTQVTTSEYVQGVKVKEKADFRSYASFEQSFNDYVDFLQSNGRYRQALQATANPERFVSELQQAGYATDPQYARKISQIAQKVQTYQQVASVEQSRTNVRA
ncbi:flagellar assembly peptidoglycan hydrolase FlgJ [Denitrificimonas caeni]|uniref:Peptidoglycan hydrolase FlgJ n=1 Tax=Denitrificimonas caeni TaxID=521720 RepID=A0AAE9VN80_9GAMM|nr:flagellar assembly peptidoglycan hydrolase FlgJ [Denitrificimonas caeni]WBE24862.1 flagellar assembly peptidoglycan hydrolase FlgJ [Denitrificimonas caeni]